MNPKLKYLLTSRKFWAAMVGIIVAMMKAFWPAFPLTEEQLIPIVVLLVTFILGTAIEDAGQAIGSRPPPGK